MVPRNPIQAAAGVDLLGIIFFSLVFGAALTLIPEEKARPLLRVLDAVGEAVVKIIDLAMKLAPYGVFGLIFFTTSRFGWGLLRQLGLYVIIVLAGLVIHGSVSLSILVRVFGGLKPRVFWSRIRASIITAFSTSSSNATLPTNIAVAEEELKIPPTIAGFVLPLGSTMCMNGTALYEGVTVLFLAQVFGVSLDLGGQIVVLILSVITAVGAAGVPGGSLPLLMVVLATVGVPAEGIAIILGVDRILDMCRTTVNVCGDLTAAVRSPQTFTVVRHISRMRSTPRMIAIPSAGTPTVASTTIKRGSEPPGTPAAPTAVMTLKIRTTIWPPRSSDTPKTCARKSTVTPS